MIAWSEYFKSYIRVVTFSSHTDWTFIKCNEKGEWNIKNNRPMKANSSYYNFKWAKVVK